MIRTVVYPRKGDRPGAVPQSTVEVDDQPPDDYKAKLVKYVPAEVIAFYIPAYALASKSGSVAAGSRGETAQIVVIIISILGLIGYLFLRSDKSSPPRPYFYLLSVLAFLAWAIGTSSVGQDVFHLPETLNEFTVLAAVFLIPMLDDLITRVFAFKSRT
jgi:hypothetical protein